MTFVGGINEDDTVYCALPLYHTNGGILAAGQMLLRGSTLALRRKFSASQFWNDCIKYRVTVSLYNTVFNINVSCQLTNCLIW